MLASLMLKEYYLSNPDELKSLVVETERAWQALGKVHYGKTDKELKSAKYRRSVYVIKDIEEGEIFSVQNIKIIRPGLGAEPKYFEKFLGKKATRKFKRGEPLKLESFL